MRHALQLLNEEPSQASEEDLDFLAEVITRVRHAQIGVETHDKTTDIEITWTRAWLCKASYQIEDTTAKKKGKK